MDHAGNLYIADTCNQRIRKIDISGNITTVAGNGTTGYSGDGGPATAASLFYPYGVTVDTGGNVFIADSVNRRVRRVDSATGMITTIAGNGSATSSGDGGLAISAGVEPSALAVDAAGNLYIADAARVRKVATNGIISTIAGNGLENHSGDGGQATTAQTYTPDAVVKDQNGNIYFSETYSYSIRKISPGGTISTYGGTGTYPQTVTSGDGGPATGADMLPTGLALDGSGNLYFCNLGSSIRKIDVSGVITTVNAQVACAGIASDNAANLYVADPQGGMIRKIDSAGTVTPVAGGAQGPGVTFGGDGGPAIYASFNMPEYVAVDGSGNIYISDSGNNRVRRIDQSGIISTIAGSGSNAGFSGDGVRRLKLRYSFLLALH